MAGPATILIVDDEPKNVDYLEQELEGFGYSTVSASNGAEALAIVETTPPALILLDVMMPVMDGFKTCSILKASDETRFIPVIIMTALDAVEDRVKGIKAGADDFLTKPVDERELIARIETSLRLKEAMDRKVSRAAAAERSLREIRSVCRQRSRCTKSRRTGFCQAGARCLHPVSRH